MKKKLKISVVTFIIVLLFAVCSPFAMAETYTHCADALNGLGLFKGTANGYELTKTPTRAEAAVMLVRLLGKESAAADSNDSHPFMDVPAWADDAIAYMYANGLTKGISDNMFGTHIPCTAQMFYVFTLRALGYSESENDFTYNNAENFALKQGLAPVYRTNGFLRDDMVAVSYSALAAKIKGEDVLLLSWLVEQGAVDAKRAQPLLDMFDDYANFINADIANASATAFSTDFTIKLTFTYQNNKINLSMDGSMAAKPNSKANSTVDMLFTYTLAKNKTQVSALSAYLVDDIMYMAVNDEKFSYEYTAEEQPSWAVSVQPISFNDYQAATISRLYAIKQTGNTYQLYVDSLDNLLGFDTLITMMLTDTLSATMLKNTSWDNLLLTCGYADDKLATLHINSKMQLRDSKNTTEVQVDISLHSMSWNEKVKISAPDDAKKYLSAN